MSQSRTFALALLAAASLAAALPGSALAQRAALQEPKVASETSIRQQLARIGERVDRYVAQGRLTKTDGVELHRQINAIEDAASADRETHGGSLNVADRFDVDSKIKDLKDDLHLRLTQLSGKPAG